MKPTLVLLNGNPGMGKTTLARRYADEHPMTLCLDIDHIWFMMGQWQQYRPESDKLKYAYAELLAEAHISRGYSVIVPQLFESPELCACFEQIAQKHHAHFRELALISTADDAIERCKARGKAQGYASGFRPGGVLDTNGREAKLRSMHENLLNVIKSRKQTVCITSINGRADETYEALLAAI